MFCFLGGVTLDFAENPFAKPPHPWLDKTGTICQIGVQPGNGKKALSAGFGQLSCLTDVSVQMLQDTAFGCILACVLGDLFFPKGRKTLKRTFTPLIVPNAPE